jgi:hypothetical protein
VRRRNNVTESEPSLPHAGFTGAFSNREVARDILFETLPKGVSLNEEANKAMQYDGIYVLALDNLIEQEACKDWDPRALEPPPKKWDCPGY